MLNGLATDDHFARTKGGVTTYFLTDAVGSTIALTDSNGNLQRQYSYAAFGYTVPSGPANDNPYQFAGREVVDNTFSTIYYNRARYLDTFQFMRFLSRDPVGFTGGNYASLYAYVGNSPLNGTDPTGAEAFLCGWSASDWAIEFGKAAMARIGAAEIAGASVESGSNQGNAGTAQTATGTTSAGSNGDSAGSNADVQSATKAGYISAWGSAAGAMTQAILHGAPGVDVAVELAWGAAWSGDFSARGVTETAVAVASGIAVGEIAMGDAFLGAEVGSAGGPLGAAGGFLVGTAVGVGVAEFYAYSGSATLAPSTAP